MPINFTMALSSAPADQTASFGAATLSGAGGYQAIDGSGSAITNATDAGTGTASGYTLTSGGIITPSSNGGLAAQDGQTIAIASDQGSFTVTLNVAAGNVYTCSSQAEWGAAVGACDRTQDNTFAFRKVASAYTHFGPIDNLKNFNTAPTDGRITVTSADPNNMAVFHRIIVRNWDNITIDGLEIVDETEVAGEGVAIIGTTTGFCGTTWNRRIIVANNYIHGVFDAGGVTPDLQDTTLLTANGEGIAGWLEFGVTTQGTQNEVNNGNIEVKDNIIKWVREAISCPRTSDRLDVVGNRIEYFSGDCIKAPTTGTFNCLWNEILFNIGKNGDFGGTLHSDMIQWAGGGVDTVNHTIIGNRFISGGTRGDPAQLIFGDDWHSVGDGDAINTGLKGALIAGNYGYSKGSNAGIKVLHAESLTAHDNLFVSDPGATDNVTGALRIEVGTDHTAGAHIVKYNAAEHYNLSTAGGDSPSTATVDQGDPNTNVRVNTASEYAAAYVGPLSGDFTEVPSDISELMSWYVAKAGGPLVTANVDGGSLGTDNPRVDFANRTYTPLP